MKKIYLLVAAAMTMAACSQDEIILNNDATMEEVDSRSILEATISAESRMNIDGLKVTWSKDDSFNAFDKDNKTSTYTLIGEKGKLFARMGGEADSMNLTKAIYPANEKNSIEKDVITFNLPTTYSSDAVSRSIPMVGTVKENAVKFSQYLTAVLNIKVGNMPEGYNKLVIKGSHAITGKFTYDFNTMTTSAGTDKNITIENVSDMQNLYVPVAGNTEHKFLHIVAYNGNKELGIVTLKWQKLEAGKLYTVTYDYKDYLPVMENGELPKIDKNDMFKTLTASRWNNLKNNDEKMVYKDGILTLTGDKKLSWWQGVSLFIKDGLKKNCMGRISFKAKGVFGQMSVDARVKDSDGKVYFMPINNYVDKTNNTIKQVNVGANYTEFTFWIDFSRHSKNTDKPTFNAQFVANSKPASNDFSFEIFTNVTKANHHLEIKDVTFTQVYGTTEK